MIDILHDNDASVGDLRAEIERLRALLNDSHREIERLRADNDQLMIELKHVAGAELLEITRLRAENSDLKRIIALAKFEDKPPLSPAALQPEGRVEKVR